MATQPLAEAFPVGDFLAEELEERGWSEADFTAIMGRPTLSLIHISEPTRREWLSRMPSSA